jgi:glycerol-3-phosphate acyltransferase PlsY
MYFVVILLSYIIGSIPTGLLIGRLMGGIDLRQYGSKNIGATNAFRVLGPLPAFCVFLADAAKGVAGVFLGQQLIGSPIALLAGGIAAIAGHNWSLFLGLRGGRGVATGLGVIAFLTPKVTAVVFIVWVVIVYFTRYVSLGSVVAAALVPILMWVFGETLEYLIFGIIAALFVIIRHKSNIERLLKGKELKIQAGSIASQREKEK